MNNSIPNKLIICWLLLCVVGCAENKYVKTIDQFCLPSATRTDSTPSASSPQAAAMSAGEQVLANMHFAIEKLDADTGYIRTYPLSGSQSFEFWRADSVGSFNQTEADLHSIRRTVELNISEQTGQLCINCKATTQRLSTPQNQNNTDQGILSETSRSVQTLKIGNEQKTNITWIDLGRDNQLETEILKRIEKQLIATRKEQHK